MSLNRKLMGVLAGACAVAVIGVAVAQGVMPDADIANPALGAGQQSSLGTSMGETGVPEWEKQVQTAAMPATVAQEPTPAPEPVAQAPAPAPEPVAQAPAPTPAPEPVAQAPAPAPEPVQVAEAPVARADRN